MKSALLISIYLGLISTLFYGDTFPANVPMFMQLDVNVQEASRSEARFSITGADTTIFHDIHLLYDQDSMPFIYYADILTPVCIDDICKPLYIELYWNLLGEYAGFGVYEAELLSKYDHDLFDKQDYLKLDHLLRNPYSILERKKLTDLYDPSKKRAKSIEFKGKQVDGITGATVREIKEEVVDGALFSCYALWHLVHGEAKSKIKKSISVIADKDLQRMLLKSKIKSYEMYAVKQFAVEDYEANMDHLVEIFKNAAPLDRGWILKKMPKACFSADSFVEQIYQGFSDFDSNTGTLLIRNLGHSTSLAREYLSSQLEEMTKNQLKEFLASLDVMEGVILNNLSDYASNVASVNGYIVKEFLEAR